MFLCVPCVCRFPWKPEECWIHQNGFWKSTVGPLETDSWLASQFSSPTCLRSVPPTVGWGLLCQPSVKMLSYRHGNKQSGYIKSVIMVSSFRVTPGCQCEKKKETKNKINKQKNQVRNNEQFLKTASNHFKNYSVSLAFKKYRLKQLWDSISNQSEWISRI